MIINYTIDKELKTMRSTLYTSSEFNYTNQKPSDIKLSFEDKSNPNNLQVFNMKPFNYVDFKIIKPNLDNIKTELMLKMEGATEEETKNNKNIANTFNELYPFKYEYQLTLIKKLDLDKDSNRFINMPDNDLIEFRNKHPIIERVEVPKINCSEDNSDNECIFTVRNVIAGQYYNLRIRLLYNFLNNVNNIRSTPYLNFNFHVKDTNNNSFTIKNLNIVQNLNNKAKLQNNFTKSQNKQNKTLDNITDTYSNLLNL